MKTRAITITCLSATLALCSLAADAQVPSAATQYAKFSKWGLSFEYPREWKEYPSDRVAMMKDALASQLQPYGREIQGFAMITGPGEEIALLVSKYTIPKEMQPSEFVTERNAVYDDAKRAGDVTKVNYVRETKIAALPGVDEDVERSNGGRGRTLKIINGKTVFELSFVVNRGSRFSNYSESLTHLVSTVVLAGVSATPRANQERPKDAAPSFGQSFNVIKGVSGGSYLLDGYSSYVESRSGAFAPGAVLIVGVKEGTDFDGTQFDLGAIIVVEGTSAAPRFRLARPDDNIVVTRDVTVFGKNYKKGTFAVPSGGKVSPPEN